MDIRQLLNKHQKPVAAMVILLIAVAVWIAVSQTRGSAAVKKAFYTDDDGKTYFEDDVGRVPPFERNGKTAYGVMVVDCKGSREVCYMTRFADASRALVEKARASGEIASGKFEWSKVVREYKRPGETTWVADNAQNIGRVMKIREFRCSNGSSGDPVLP